MGKLFLFFYRTLTRLKAKLFSVIISGAFEDFGSHSVIVPPARIDGEARISLGERVYVGAGSWLQTLPEVGENRVALSIGNGTSIAGNCVISAAHSVKIEDDVLLARNVYISDHIHRYSEVGVPVQAQGIEKIRAVVIRRGAWLGQNVVICPGVTVGEGAVVGANSVVTTDIPDFAVAVGAPARVVKTFAVVAG